MTTLVLRSSFSEVPHEDYHPFENSRACVGIVERDDSGCVHRVVDDSRKEPIPSGSGLHPLQQCESTFRTAGTTS